MSAVATGLTGRANENKVFEDAQRQADPPSVLETISHMATNSLTVPSSSGGERADYRTEALQRKQEFRVCWARIGPQHSLRLLFELVS